MALMLWILMVTVTMVGGVLAAITTVPARRTAGLLAATAAVSGLFILLGLDLPAAVWLGVGGAAALLGVPAGHQSDGAPARIGPHPRRGARLSGGVAAGLLFAILYRLALQIDWRPSPPRPAVGQTSMVGGHLLVADLALVAVAVVVLTVAIAVTGRRRVDHTMPGGGS